MRPFRFGLPFALFTAPVEAFVREVVAPFLLGLVGVVVVFKGWRRAR